MAALSVCFSISTRRCLVAWMRMCGNVQLGALLSSFFFRPSCAVPTFDSEGFRNATLDVSWLFCSQTLGDTDNTQTNRTVGNPDFFFFPRHYFYFFLIFAASRKKKREKKKVSNVNVSSGKVLLLSLRMRFSSDCRFCCACVFFVCLYLHSEVLRGKKK